MDETNVLYVLAWQSKDGTQCRQGYETLSTHGKSVIYGYLCSYAIMSYEYVIKDVDLMSNDLFHCVDTINMNMPSLGWL